MKNEGEGVSSMMVKRCWWAVEGDGLVLIGEVLMCVNLLLG